MYINPNSYIVDKNIENYQRIVDKKITEEFNNKLISLGLIILIYFFIIFISILFSKFINIFINTEFFIAFGISIIFIISLFRLLLLIIRTIIFMLEYYTINPFIALERCIIDKVRKEFNKNTGFLEKLVIFFSYKDEEEIIYDIGHLRSHQLSYIWKKIFIIIAIFLIYYMTYQKIFYYFTDINFSEFYSPILWGLNYIISKWYITLLFILLLIAIIVILKDIFKFIILEL